MDAFIGREAGTECDTDLKRRQVRDCPLFYMLQFDLSWIRKCRCKYAAGEIILYPCNACRRLE